LLRFQIKKLQNPLEMACTIEPNAWTEITSLVTGKLVMQDGTVMINLEDESGLLEEFGSIPIAEGAPLALRFNAAGQLEFVEGGNWNSECTEVMEIGPLAPAAGGFAFDDKGIGLGYFQADGEMELFYLNLDGFAVVFALEGGGLWLRFLGGDAGKFYLVGL
jgi:hypothetical protein